MPRTQNTEQFLLDDVLTDTVTNRVLQECKVLATHMHTLLRASDAPLCSTDGRMVVVDCGRDLRGYAVLLIVERTKPYSDKVKRVYVAAGCRRFKSLQNAVKWWTTPIPGQSKYRRTSSRYILAMLKQGIVSLQNHTDLKVAWPKKG